MHRKRGTTSMAARKKTRQQKRKQTSRSRATKTRQRITVKKTRATLNVEKPTLHVRVSRYNPQLDFHARTHEYHVTLNNGESVLDLLTRIHETQDGSLTFRGSCGYGGCGSCGVKVNGKTVLGCVTQVSDLMTEHHTLHVEPLHDNVIKDLVVDEKPFFDELEKVIPWITPRANDVKRNHKMGVNDVQKLGNAHQCILCGVCNANVESQKTGELGPAAMVKAYRYRMDVRDANTQRHSLISKQFPIHYSLEKANACPRSIFPGDKIKELRELTRKTKNTFNEVKK